MYTNNIKLHYVQWHINIHKYIRSNINNFKYQIDNNRTQILPIAIEKKLVHKFITNLIH